MEANYVVAVVVALAFVAFVVYKVKAAKKAKDEYEKSGSYGGGGLKDGGKEKQVEK